MGNEERERLHGGEQEMKIMNPVYDDSKQKNGVNGVPDDHEMQYNISLLSDQGKYKAKERRKKKCCYACIIMVLILVLATCIAALVTLALHAHNKGVEQHVDQDQSSEVNGVIYIVNYNYTDKYSDVLTEKSKQLTAELLDELDKVFDNMETGDDISHVAVNHIRKGSIIIDVTFYFKTLHYQVDLKTFIINGFKETIRITRDQKCYLGRFQIDMQRTKFTAIKWNGTTTTSNTPTISRTSTSLITSTVIVTGPPATCEPITNRICLGSEMTYTQTGFPNYLGHNSQAETDVLTHQLHFFLMGTCYPSGKRFVCSILTPKCENNALVPPCKQMCEDFFRKCQSSIPDVFRQIDCSGFPDESTGQCITAPALPDMNVRLKTVPGGTNPLSGAVEIEYFPNHWIPLCGRNWGDEDGDVICKQLKHGKAKKTWTQIDQSGLMTFINGVNCIGTENNLGQCELILSSDIPIPCDNTAMLECDELSKDIAELQLRLTGGTATEGRLEVYYQGTWGTVCDDLFGVKEATVACRMLGLSMADASVIDSSAFGDSDQAIHLDDVECIGNEDNLGLCKHQEWGHTNCVHREDVAISCPGKTVPPAKSTTKTTSGTSPPSTKIATTPKSMSTTTPKIISTTTKPTTAMPLLYDLRLEDGTPFQSGRLEIRMTGSEEWGTVCRSMFNDNAATVFCKMMGYQSGVYELSKYGAGQGPIAINFINCDGTEETINQCSYDVDVEHCSHTDDVSISCRHNF